jgi:hypothetical protein
MNDCLHCRLMAVIDDWRAENPNEETEIFPRLAETMGHMLALVERVDPDGLNQAIDAMCAQVFESFVVYRATQEFESDEAEPKGSVH